MDYKSLLKEMGESDIDVSTIQVGDLVNLNEWYGDIWSEVLGVFGNYTLHCMYSKYGDERWTLLTNNNNIHKVTTKDDPELNHATAVHLANGKLGIYGKEWPTSLTRESSKRYHSNTPEVHPDTRKQRGY